jgi:acyl-CoA hydrolase
MILIYSAGSTGEPLTFFRNLHTLKGKVNNLTLHLNLSNENIDAYSNEQYRDLFNIQASFFPRIYSPLQKTGRRTYMPTHLRNMGSDPLYNYRRTDRHINVFISAVSPMDKHGYFTTGSYAAYCRSMIEFADLVILEVNDSIPRTFGDTYVHISEADII